MTVRETLRSLAPVIGEKTDKLWWAYLATNPKARRDFEASLESYAAHLLRDHPSSAQAGLFPPPPAERSLGEIDLGFTKYGGAKGHLFGLRLSELIRHIGVYGSSGSGKSNAIALIVDGLSHAGIPFLLIDFKRTFRALIKDYPALLVFTAGDARTAPFRFNPLIPPEGISVEVWSKKIIGALSHAYCQGAGSESLLITALREAYEAAEKEGRWPTFQDVGEMLDREPAKGRKAMWKDSAQRAVRSLSRGNAAEVFCPATPVDIVGLLQSCAVLELDLLNQAEQTMLAESLLLFVMSKRMQENTGRESLKHAIIIEEAHHLLRSPPGVGDGTEPIVHTCLRESRELGECVVTITQDASIVPLPVFGNQATTIALHTKHASDVRATAQAMLLKDEAKDELGRLPVGEAIVRVPRWPDTVHVKLNMRPLAKGTVSDAQIRQRMAFQADSVNTRAKRPTLGCEDKNRDVPSAEDKDLNTVESKEPSTDVSPINHRYSPTATPEESNRNTDFLEPTPLELGMIRDILEHPFDGVVTRIKRLGASRRKGSAALSALEQRGLLAPANVYTGKSLIKLFDLTGDGRQFCRERQLGPIQNPTAGGIEHRYWVDSTAARLRSKGWKVKTEYLVHDGLILDVHAERNDRILAILVETGKSDVKGNIMKTAEAGYGRIAVVSGNPEVKKTALSARADLPVGCQLSFRSVPF